MDNEIVLPKDAGKKAIKYKLNELRTEFQGKTIEAIFSDSVNEGMSRITFNSFAEICGWAKK